MRDSFVFYRSFFEAIKELPDKERLEIYETICLFSLEKKESTISGASKALWILIKPQLQANYRKYENGMKPKKLSKKTAKITEDLTISKSEATDKQTISKSEANVNVNDNVNDNVNVNVNDNVKEKKDNTLSQCLATNNYLPYFDANKSEHIKIIGYYVDFCGTKFDNAEQVSGFIKRWLRPASNLKGYSKDRIYQTMAYLNNQKISGKPMEWDLGTVGKWIDK